MSRNPSEARGWGDQYSGTGQTDGGIAAGVGDRDGGLWLGAGPSKSRPNNCFTIARHGLTPSHSAPHVKVSGPPSLGRPCARRPKRRERWLAIPRWRRPHTHTPRPDPAALDPGRVSGEGLARLRLPGVVCVSVTRHEPLPSCFGPWPAAWEGIAPRREHVPCRSGPELRLR